ncbi:MAG TPA: flagellar biosynthetic protein FliR [Caulobacteraceae bacterium]|nr:flagellar biosynthetic protein FliR [Caulobacteraceae bacterium]
MEHYFSAQQLFAGGLVFARIGAIIMILPGLGTQVAPQARLAFAVLTCLVVTPAVYPLLPIMPGDLGDLAGDVVREVLIGLAIGAILSTFLAAMALAGEVVSLQTTLSFAQTANPTSSQQNTTIATFLALLATVLIFTTDLHQLFIGALVRSYTLFPFGHPPPVQDFAQLAIRTTAGAFALGVELTAPVLVFSLVFHIAIGLVGRAMPHFQIFFAATPLTVLLGLSLLALSLGLMGGFWIDRYRQVLSAFG